MDLLSHKVVLVKLSWSMSCVIEVDNLSSGSTVSWIDNWLCMRKQTVALGGKLSSGAVYTI